MSLATTERPTVAYKIELKAETAEALAAAAQARHMPAEELIAASIDLFLSEDLTDYEFSDDDIAAIEEGIAQLKRGEGVPQEEVMERLKAKYGG